ncbi:hypothetical protein GV819_17240 [Pseudomonas sp. Fl5BN2]|uniref:hypothetical protein n=1 Tax=unclassified Pseudomonas TaxID=196821 RepID=UPI0013769231|nr:MULTISPECIES: hypothetical protein [unclassified Pseudomonas]NBF04032.1 hypothetical protein [Pseudomonas sp. Fl5BN2]NBF09721.1 hypothetical protein [Pseudomonas sp. Fl4BN1]
MSTRALRGCLLALCMPLLLSACGPNVRLMHPDPSKELLIRAMTELNGFHAYDRNGYEDNNLLSVSEANALLDDSSRINDSTPDFMFAHIKGRTLNIIGYSSTYRPWGQNYQTPMIYTYVGELKRARYALPHMAPTSQELRFTSTPVEKLKVALLPLSSGRVVYPDFNGELNIGLDNGRYSRISAFTRKRDLVF